VASVYADSAAVATVAVAGFAARPGITAPALDSTASTSCTRWASGTSRSVSALSNRLVRAEEQDRPEDGDAEGRAHLARRALGPGALAAALHGDVGEDDPGQLCRGEPDPDAVDEEQRDHHGPRRVRPDDEGEAGDPEDLQQDS
jgi:hypothetical protein